jgi:hypothetical protein
MTAVRKKAERGPGQYKQSCLSANNTTSQRSQRQQRGSKGSRGKCTTCQPVYWLWPIFGNYELLQWVFSGSIGKRRWPNQVPRRTVGGGGEAVHQEAETTAVLDKCGRG